jgi:hypothetical protein
MASRSIGQVAAYKPLARCNMEELAAHYGYGYNPSGGVLFARADSREQKDIARNSIIDLFTLSAWPDHLSILTMPSSEWCFERKLLGKREGNWFRLAGPSKTRITGVENDRLIYYSAVTKMPGLHTRRALVQSVPAPTFAEQGVRTKFIGGFYFANVDDLMEETTEAWDAAWLDYTGPLTIERMKLIKAFYERSVRRILIVTALKARWNKDTSVAILRAGGHSEWLRKNLEGEVLQDIEYFDTSPMTQFAVRKEVSDAQA